MEVLHAIKDIGFHCGFAPVSLPVKALSRSDNAMYAQTVHAPSELNISQTCTQHLTGGRNFCDEASSYHNYVYEPLLVHLKPNADSDKAAVNGFSHMSVGGRVEHPSAIVNPLLCSSAATNLGSNEVAQESVGLPEIAVVHIFRPSECSSNAPDMPWGWGHVRQVLYGECLEAPVVILAIETIRRTKVKKGGLCSYVGSVISQCSTVKETA